VFSFDLLLNSIVAGLLVGGFYAAVTLGLSVAFGLLDVVNIAHPVFVILGSYVAFVMYENFGVDPILAGVIFTPVFYFLGVVIYRIY
jgi:branched-chain amino acid transport system permease protein